MVQFELAFLEHLLAVRKLLQRARSDELQALVQRHHRAYAGHGVPLRAVPHHDIRFVLLVRQLSAGIRQVLEVQELAFEYALVGLPVLDVEVKKLVGFELALLEVALYSLVLGFDAALALGVQVYDDFVGLGFASRALATKYFADQVLHYIIATQTTHHCRV